MGANQQSKNLDTEDGGGLLPHSGTTKNNPISVEQYTEERDLQAAIQASLKKSTSDRRSFIDLCEESRDYYIFFYDDDDDIRILESDPGTTAFGERSKKGKRKPLSSPSVTETGQSSNSQNNVPSTFLCEICFEPKPQNDLFHIQNCSHSYCTDCVSKYVAAKLQDNITSISCPVSECKGSLEPEYCRDILPQEVFDRWGNALCEAIIMGAQKFYCPFKDCSALLIDDGDVIVMESECPNCRRLFCAQCRVPWHGEIECDEFQKLNKDEREREDIMLKKLAESKRWRRCPNCGFYVEKKEGCRYMKCRCGAAFCYTCGYSSNRSFDQTHYCTICKG